MVVEGLHTCTKIPVFTLPVKFYSSRKSLVTSFNHLTHQCYHVCFTVPLILGYIITHCHHCSCRLWGLLLLLFLNLHPDCSLSLPNPDVTVSVAVVAMSNTNQSLFLYPVKLLQSLWSFQSSSCQSKCLQTLPVFPVLSWLSVSMLRSLAFHSVTPLLSQSIKSALN